MSTKNEQRLTFALLDREKGLPELTLVPEEEFPLPAWYRSVRETPLEELGVGDVCKACRQRIHLDRVVPIALHRLQSDPLAGEMYDGELIVSLNSVAADFWRNHPAETTALRSIIEAVSLDERVTHDILEDANELRQKLMS